MCSSFGVGKQTAVNMEDTRGPGRGSSFNINVEAASRKNILFRVSLEWEVIVKPLSSAFRVSNQNRRI